MIKDRLQVIQQPINQSIGVGFTCERNLQPKNSSAWKSSLNLISKVMFLPPSPHPQRLAYIQNIMLVNDKVDALRNGDWLQKINRCGRQLPRVYFGQLLTLLLNRNRFAKLCPKFFFYSRPRISCVRLAAASNASLMMRVSVCPVSWASFSRASRAFSERLTVLRLATHFVDILLKTPNYEYSVCIHLMYTYQQFIRCIRSLPLKQQTLRSSGGFGRLNLVVSRGYNALDLS